MTPSDRDAAVYLSGTRYPTPAAIAARMRRAHFCGNCGQETRLALPTFGAFMREAAGRYFAMDGRFWRTMAALVGKPGFLTKEYLRGRRKRYIRPARLFLVLYLVLFAAIGLLQSPGNLSDEIVFVDGAAQQKAGEGAATTAAPPAKVEELDEAIAMVSSDDGATFFGLDRDLNLTLRLANADVPLPLQVRKRWDHFKKLPREEKAERLYAGILRFAPYAMVALLPAFALLLKLGYLGRGRAYPERPQRYAEHLVYSAHLHAFAAVMLLAMLLLPFDLAKFILAGWIVYYVMRARQNVYGGRWWAGLLRAMVIGVDLFRAARPGDGGARVPGGDAAVARGRLARRDGAPRS